VEVEQLQWRIVVAAASRCGFIVLIGILSFFADFT
jgi:hypothetical protein